MAAPLKMTYTNLVLQKLPEEILTKGPCGSVKDPDIFFDDEVNDFAQARSICAACPLVEMCLEYALANENEGFWGGMSSEERMALNVEPVVSPEVRREAAEIRAVISSNLTVKLMAQKLDVTERTVYRYKAKLRAELELESPTWIFSTSDTAAFVQALNVLQDDAQYDLPDELPGDDLESGYSQTA